MSKTYHLYSQELRFDIGSSLAKVQGRRAGAGWDRARKRIAKGFALSSKLILDFWENHADGPCQSKDGVFIFP